MRVSSDCSANSAIPHFLSNSNPFCHVIFSVWSIESFALLVLVFYSRGKVFLKNGPFPASFSLFSSYQYTVDSKQMFDMNNFLLMTGFEPWISGIGSDRSTN